MDFSYLNNLNQQENFFNKIVSILKFSMVESAPNFFRPRDKISESRYRYSAKSLERPGAE